MGAYLTQHPPARAQWFHRRNRPLTGCTVLHDAENLMDTVGPDTGAEQVAEFIRTRATPGSYHDLVDSDSGIYLVDYVHGAFHDGTGSNNWALSLSFACRTVDWARMAPAKRAGFLRHGAIRWVAQQLWRKSVGAPLTRLRYITKEQSDAGQSGFCCHGWRDPDRRSDPGTQPPNLFPFDEWLDACRAALAQLMPDHPDAPPQGDDMTGPQEQLLRDTLTTAKGAAQMATEARNWIIDPARGILAQLSRLAAAVAADRDDVDDQALAQQVIAGLAPQVAAAAGSQAGLTEEQIRKITEDVVRRVFADAGARPAT